MCDAFELTLAGRDRTYSTILFANGVIAHVAHDEHCELPAIFTRLRIG